MKKLLDIIVSRRFAIWILVFTTAIILLSNLLPKPYILNEKELDALRKERPVIFALSQRFNVARVTQSPPFVTVVLFLFLSITACTIKRSKRFLESEGERPPSISTIKTTLSIDVDDPSKAERKVMHMLLGKRWKVISAEGDGKKLAYARKGGAGFWGSIAFHVGMCLVLIGALTSSMTRYNGSMVLTEGFGAEPYKALGGLTKDEREWFPLREVIIDSFRPEYSGPFPVDYTADILYLDNIYGQVRKKSVRVNEPLHVNEYQFILTRYGFAPRFLLKDSKGEIISDDVIVLVVITPDKEDTFVLLDGKLEVKARFYPDFYREKDTGVPKTRSRIPQNPMFSVKIIKEGKEIGGGLVPMGGGLDFGDHRIEFKDIRYWAQLDVSRDSGLPWITAGFFTIVGGLVARLLLNEKSLWVIISGNNIGVGGRARYFPALFEEELKMLAENLIATEVTEDTEKK